MPKTVSSSKFQEWKGLDRLTQVVHEMHCIFREISKDDYGIDGEIEVVVPKADGNGYETAPGIIKVQVKSGPSYVKQDSPNGFFTPVSKTDLEDWYRSNFPVAFVVYHDADDSLYWQDVGSYVTSTSGIWSTPFKIVFDKNRDRLTSECADALRCMAGIGAPRVSLSTQERHYLNLFRVAVLPKLITSSPTDLPDFVSVRAAVPEHGSPFCVLDGYLITLADCAIRGAPFGPRATPGVSPISP